LDPLSPFVAPDSGVKICAFVRALVAVAINHPVLFHEQLGCRRASAWFLHNAALTQRKQELLALSDETSPLHHKNKIKNVHGDGDKNSGDDKKVKKASSGSDATTEAAAASAEATASLLKRFKNRTLPFEFLWLRYGSDLRYELDVLARLHVKKRERMAWLSVEKLGKKVKHRLMFKVELQREKERQAAERVARKLEAQEKAEKVAALEAGESLEKHRLRIKREQHQVGHHGFFFLFIFYFFIVARSPQEKQKTKTKKHTPFFSSLSHPCSKHRHIFSFFLIPNPFPTHLPYVIDY
jgi:hypothetical protein